MRIGKQRDNWIRAAVMGAVLGPTAVLAEFPRPLETLGRLHGVCWGDGYHACASSGIRLRADLPPKSYSTSYGARPHLKPRGIVHRIGATYYDRFDAANSHACDAIGCDSGSCDGLPCDCGLVVAPHGSQVSQTPISMSPTPGAIAKAAKPTIPALDPVIKSTQPLTFVAQTKKFPTRPQAPDQVQRPEATPVASKQMSQVPTADLLVSQPSITTTPGTINPIHPGNAPSTPTRLSLPGNPIATLTPSLVMTAPGIAVPAPETVVTAPEAVVTAPNEVSAPKTGPGVESSVATGPGFVPAYAIAPYAGLAATQAAADVQPPAAPVRLGAETAQGPMPAPKIDSMAEIKRPKRLGDNGADLRINPFASRPVVEMAKRSSESSEGVIFQPSGGSLK